MSDLTDLSTVTGEPLDEATIRGILAQIDLDVMNLVRDGKLAAARYAVAGGSTDRAACLVAMLEARRTYERLLDALPAEAISHGEVVEE